MFCAVCGLQAVTLGTACCVARDVDQQQEPVHLALCVGSGSLSLSLDSPLGPHRQRSPPSYTAVPSASQETPRAPPAALSRTAAADVLAADELAHPPDRRVCRRPSELACHRARAVVTLGSLHVGLRAGRLLLITCRQLVDLRTCGDTRGRSGPPRRAAETTDRHRPGPQQPEPQHHNEQDRAGLATNTRRLAARPEAAL